MFRVSHTHDIIGSRTMTFTVAFLCCFMLQSSWVLHQTQTNFGEFSLGDWVDHLAWWTPTVLAQSLKKSYRRVPSRSGSMAKSLFTFWGNIEIGKLMWRSTLLCLSSLGCKTNDPCSSCLECLTEFIHLRKEDCCLTKRPITSSCFASAKVGCSFFNTDSVLF